MTKLFLITTFLAVPLLHLHADQHIRREENNKEFSIQVFESSIKIVRKADNASGELKGILWGDGPTRTALPSIMLGKTDSTLLVPMLDYSYWLIDLDAYVEDVANRPSYILAKIEGGGRKGRVFDRTRTYWSLDKNLGKGLLQGGVMDDRDNSGVYFLDLNQNLVVVKAESTKEMLVIRSVSADEDSECTFEVVVDSEAHGRYVEMQEQ